MLGFGGLRCFLLEKKKVNATNVFILILEGEKKITRIDTSKPKERELRRTQLKLLRSTRLQGPCYSLQRASLSRLQCPALASIPCQSWSRQQNTQLSNWEAKSLPLIKHATKQRLIFVRSLLFSRTACSKRSTPRSP